MMGVFNHTLHKALWDILANNPHITEKEGMEILKKYQPGFMGIIVGNCFACHAQYTLGCDLDVNGDNSLSLSLCYTKNCPLYWGEDADIDFGCSWTDSGYNGIFSKWQSAKDAETRKALAERIRDLPLSDAKELYTII